MLHLLECIYAQRLELFVTEYFMNVVIVREWHIVVNGKPLVYAPINDAISELSISGADKHGLRRGADQHVLDRLCPLCIHWLDYTFLCVDPRNGCSTGSTGPLSTEIMDENDVFSLGLWEWGVTESPASKPSMRYRGRRHYSQIPSAENSY